jgi:hypothetical protein
VRVAELVSSIRQTLPTQEPSVRSAVRVDELASSIHQTLPAASQVAVAASFAAHQAGRYSERALEPRRNDELSPHACMSIQPGGKSCGNVR